MAKKVLVLVEGQTEEGFMNRVLGPYLGSKEIYLTPTIIKTKREIRGPDHKGGVKSYRQVKRDLAPLLNDTSADIITTMIDYYALPSDFPGYNLRPAGNCYARVEFMENEFEKDINNPKFLPYLQLHEFEALVFASEDKLPTAFINVPRKIAQVAAVSNSFKSPEEINEGPTSAPSKRLLNIFPDYQKTYHSQLILSQVSIDVLRAKCFHFNAWLLKLEI
ncbi:MAG: DUF4276 family protein [Ignavibacteriales bacterium]|nr:DUF4276 family protein [Ignavibacteriales bacterium]